MTTQMMGRWWLLDSLMARRRLLRLGSVTPRAVQDERGVLQSRNPFRRYCGRSRRIGNGLVVALIDVHDSATDDASCGFRVDMHRQGERTDVRIILHEIDLLDEDRRRFHGPALGSNQASGVNV